MKKKFYRVCNVETQQGLWYNQQGNFTGLIHNRFNFCKNCNLEMEFDDELVGYLSATPELGDLYVWFTEEDILTLQQEGYYIHVYETKDYKFYEKFQHYVINQESSVLIDKIVLNQLTTI